uniref:Uncharacterized protein n=1 Tax=Arundo donax TaxID=35708 RepID=A0A0A8ZTB5_ARUDO
MTRSVVPGFLFCSCCGSVVHGDICLLV